MSCRRIERWILRHGAGNLPAQWREHIAGCERCQAIVAQVSALDEALVQSEVPDPGESYWENFAPRLARRLETVPAKRLESVTARRPAWIRRLVPAAGIAILALLIARDVVIDRQPPTRMESDVPIAVQKTKPATPEAAPAVQPARETMQRLGAGEPRADAEQPAITRTSPSPAVPDQRSDASEPSPAERTVTDRGAPAETGNLNDQESEGTIDALTKVPNQPEETDETSVWPDRRVTKMGEIDSDRTRELADDEHRLEAPGATEFEDDTYGMAIVGAETSAALPPPLRLEAPQTFRASRFNDRQSPAEAMRRFEELQELRRDIDAIAAIDPSKRTADQERELCAMWYRVGVITTEVPVLDSAIQHVADCAQTLDETDKEEWQEKGRQLTERRQTIKQ
jgi:hypothetical protein